MDQQRDARPRQLSQLFQDIAAKEDLFGDGPNEDHRDSLKDNAPWRDRPRERSRRGVAEDGSRQCDDEYHRDEREKEHAEEPYPMPPRMRQPLGIKTRRLRSHFRQQERKTGDQGVVKNVPGGKPLPGGGREGKVFCDFGEDQRSDQDAQDGTSTPRDGLAGVSGVRLGGRRFHRFVFVGVHLSIPKNQRTDFQPLTVHVPRSALRSTRR